MRTTQNNDDCSHCLSELYQQLANQQLAILCIDAIKSIRQAGALRPPGRPRFAGRAALRRAGRFVERTVSPVLHISLTS
jgi:hypothetical protein